MRFSGTLVRSNSKVVVVRFPELKLEEAAKRL